MSERILLHVDMDAFYVSVELRRHPELRRPGLPVWVGGEQRGVVLSANYEARRYGVEGGMSATRARRLCPQAVALRPDFDAYQAASRGVFALFDTISPIVEGVSIDEAFIDVTGAGPLLGSPRVIAERIRAQVADEQGITCSVGIGPTKLVAKMASTSAKPDGVREVLPEGVTAFLHPLEVERLWGVGDATAGRLRQLGLVTIGDVARTPVGTLQRALGAHLGRQLADLAWGRDPRRVTPKPVERSIGSEETFGRDTDDPETITAEILRLADRTTRRMRRHRMLGRTVVLSLRFADFTGLTRSVTVPSPVDSCEEVYAAALGLWHKLALQRARIRRVGVRVEGLVPAEEAHQQLPLDAPDVGWREAEQAIDAAITRFGPQAVQRARLTRRDGRRPEPSTTGSGGAVPGDQPVLC